MALVFPSSSPLPPAAFRAGGKRRSVAPRCLCSCSPATPVEAVAEEAGPVVRFTPDDLAVADRVSLGLQGRSDELIFEATVQDRNSLLYGSRVVLRQLTSVQAKRRGRRALEVLKKLARRHIMYHSYAMQVHGYVAQTDDLNDGPFTLVHGYHGSYSLRHWLQFSDWLPTLEVALALDEEHVRRVGDDTIGGPAVTRQLRLTRILMRDLLIGVNYLHSHGVAHTELRLENVHISPVDKHIKVGILGNSVDFCDNNQTKCTRDSADRKKLMIAFDIRCIGFIMAKLIIRELIDPSVFVKFKSFLTTGNDPSCLREFLLPLLARNCPSGNIGLQMLDRNWGAGWHLLSCLLATKPSERISCLEALRHPFLCGPRWRVNPSIDVIRWGLGSTTVQMAEDYIYGHDQRRQIAYFIELMELLNPNPKPKNWFHLFPGRWRLLYCTGRHIGLTLRQPSPRVLISNVHLTIKQAPASLPATFSLVSETQFKIMSAVQWPHDKSGNSGMLHVKTSARIAFGKIIFSEDTDEDGGTGARSRRLHARKWKKVTRMEEMPSSLPAVKLAGSENDISMSTERSLASLEDAQKVLREVRMQIPPEMFNLPRLVCGTYIDARMMVLRSVDGSALLFIRSCPMKELW